MNPINFNPSEIDQFLNSVRNYDDAIGNYEQHLMLPDDFTYSIKLTNGTIRIYKEELQDKQALPQERFKDIAARFNQKR